MRSIFILTACTISGLAGGLGQSKGLVVSGRRDRASSRLAPWVSSLSRLPNRIGTFCVRQMRRRARSKKRQQYNIICEIDLKMYYFKKIASPPSCFERYLVNNADLLPPVVALHP
jgi:hypothetical protein